MIRVTPLTGPTSTPVEHSNVQDVALETCGGMIVLSLYDATGKRLVQYAPGTWLYWEKEPPAEPPSA